MRGVASMVFAFVAAGLGMGCASLPPCPHRGGPAWREYATAHFDVRTDLDSDDAEKAVRDLEETRALMLATAWGRGEEPRDRTQVIVLASRSTLSVFTGVADGMFVRRSPFPSTVLFAGRTFSTLSALRHELAHDLGHWFLPVQPSWFSEGAAAYLETARYDRDSGRGYMGEVPMLRIRSIWHRGIFDVRRVLDHAVPDDPREAAAFEDTSWLLFHYLINNRHDAFVRYQGRLRALQPFPQAWKGEFPDLDSATLETTLSEYSRSGNFNVGFRTIAPWQRDVRIRAMSDAEVHSMRAYLYSSFKGPGGAYDEKAAAAELEEAFHDGRPPIDALAMAFYAKDAWHGATREMLAAQAVAAHPGSHLAWLMLADSKNIGDPAHRAALLRAYARRVDNVTVLEHLTFSTVHERRWQEALMFSSKAIDNGSLRGEVYLAHVQALAMTGQCAEAALWANVLSSLDPEAANRVSAVQSRLKEICAPARPEASAATHTGERAAD